MELFTKILEAVTSLPSAAFIGLVMFIICIAFGGGMKAAVRSALSFMVGLTGINLIIGNCVSTMQTIASGLAANFNINKPIIDGGYGVIVYLWGSPLTLLAVGAILVIDIIFIGLGWTKVLWVDIHNSWHCAWMGLIVYSITGDFVFALILTILGYILLLFIAQIVGPALSEFNNTPNVTSIAAITTIAGLFSWLCMQVIGRVPGLKDLKADPESISDTLGIFGESMVIGFVAGIVLGFFAGLDVNGIINSGINLSFTMAAFPKMAAFVCEGIVPVTTTLMTFMKKRFPNRSDLYLCVDAAVFLGEPSVMATYVLLVPIIILISIFTPAIGFIPIASLAGMVYFIGGAAPYCKGNVVHLLIVCTLYATLTAILATWLAPAITSYLLDYGFYTDTVSLAGPYMTDFDEGGGVLTAIFVFIAKIFGKINVNIPI